MRSSNVGKLIWNCLADNPVVLTRVKKIKQCRKYHKRLTPIHTAFLKHLSDF